MSPSRSRSRFLLKTVASQIGSIHAQTDKPAEQKVVVELLHEQSLAADRVQHLKQQGSKEPLRGNRRTAHLGIEALQQRRQLLQSTTGQRTDCSERMIFRHSFVCRNITEHPVLLVIGTAHPFSPWKKHQRGSVI